MSSSRDRNKHDKRTEWQTGRLPHIPRDPAEEDAVSGWFRERLLDGAFEDRAEADESPGVGAVGLPRSTERWATGSPKRGRKSVDPDDLPDYEAESEDPPERERL